jgi:hypothetical protein
MSEQRYEHSSTTEARQAFLSLSLTQLAAQQHEVFLEIETIRAMKRELASMVRSSIQTPPRRTDRRAPDRYRSRPENSSTYPSPSHQDHG